MGKVLGMSQNYGSCWTEARLGVHLEANQFAGCWFWDMSQSAHFAVWVAFFSLDSTCSIFIERKIVKNAAGVKPVQKRCATCLFFQQIDFTLTSPYFDPERGFEKPWKNHEPPIQLHEAFLKCKEVWPKEALFCFTWSRCQFPSPSETSDRASNVDERELKVTMVQFRCDAMYQVIEFNRIDL